VPINRENEFVAKIKRAHNTFQLYWVMWLPVGIISWECVSYVFSLIGVKNTLLTFPVMVLVMLMYSTFIEKKQRKLLAILCPYCGNPYFNKFPVFLRKTQCSSCSKHINFYD
jgi:hypothetical protein